jgi:hypothetical protein
LKGDLGYAREVLAKGIGISFIGIGTKAVKPDLLIKAKICGRALPRMWIPRVVEAGAVCIPGQAAPGKSRR